jgi:hypothetical protein
MTGLPKSSARNRAGVCTGDWAGHVPDDDRHCVCWWDSLDSYEQSAAVCCQCGSTETLGQWYIRNTQ